ncbi:hypothetical protein B0H17DRAFT_1185698 [Mycena rosella]|uniref:Uncharacterized protein n=1 Tax=Mycena rosella TaxID=1033263 RepID=A0AAD7CQD3_MYCRO|nr:hypothetical protein B0H17DRAFT_1185698 [Mycena rosella]
MPLVFNRRRPQTPRVSAGSKSKGAVISRHSGRPIHVSQTENPDLEEIMAVQKLGAAIPVPSCSRHRALLFARAVDLDAWADGHLPRFLKRLCAKPLATTDMETKYKVSVFVSQIEVDSLNELRSQPPSPFFTASGKFFLWRSDGSRSLRRVYLPIYRRCDDEIRGAQPAFLIGRILVAPREIVRAGDENTRVTPLQDYLKFIHHQDPRGPEGSAARVG